MLRMPTLRLTAALTLSLKAPGPHTETTIAPVCAKISSSISSCGSHLRSLRSNPVGNDLALDADSLGFEQYSRILTTLSKLFIVPNSSSQGRIHSMDSKLGMHQMSKTFCVAAVLALYPASARWTKDNWCVMPTPAAKRTSVP